MTRTFNTMLGISGKNGYLVPNLRGNAFTFSLLSMILTGFVIYDLYYAEICLYTLC